MWAFLIEAVLISLSGVIAPGPVTAVCVGHGSKSPHAGVAIAVGHGIVEFPLIFGLYLGVGAVLGQPIVATVVGVLGGVVLLWMGAGLLRTVPAQVADAAVATPMTESSPMLAGLVLSAANPYLLVWWATVGTVLIMRAGKFGVLAVVVLAVAHWTCDLIWCYLLSATAFGGGQLLGDRFQKKLFGVCGVFLLFVGVRFLLDAGAKILVLLV
jgi:threonine/homoserine/homoserine lactone efflux protein